MISRPLKLDPVLDEVPGVVREGQKESLVSSYENWRQVDQEHDKERDDGKRTREDRLGLINLWSGVTSRI
jgi:hypothetical protein